MNAVTVLFSASANLGILVLLYHALKQRKETNTMSLSLDALTSQVSTLETSATAALAEIATLQAAGENAPALDALTARIKTVSDSLIAIAPKA